MRKRKITYMQRIDTRKQGRKRPLDTSKRRRESIEKEGEREKER